MFSLLFFLFVAFVLLMGFAAVMIVRRKQKVDKQINDREPLKRDENKSTTRSFTQNAFREEKGSRIKGNILPTDSKRSKGSSRDENQTGS